MAALTELSDESRVAIGKTGAIAALIFVYRHDRMRGGDVVHALRRIPEVVSCDVMGGEFDLVVRVEAPGADRIRLVWQEIWPWPASATH